jgi:hypothetical protein
MRVKWCKLLILIELALAVGFFIISTGRQELLATGYVILAQGLGYIILALVSLLVLIIENRRSGMKAQDGQRRNGNVVPDLA